MHLQANTCFQGHQEGRCEEKEDEGDVFLGMDNCIKAEESAGMVGRQQK